MPNKLPSTEPAFFSQQVRSASRFYLNLKASSSRTLQVLCGGYEECAPDYLIRRDAFPFLTLEFVLAGKGVLRLGDRSTAIAAGMVYTYGPGIPHEIIADRRQPPRKYFINFAGRSALGFLRDCQLEPGSICAITGTSMMEHVFDNLIEHGAQGSPKSGELCDALLKYLLLRVAATATPGDDHLSAAYSTYVGCRDLIEQSFARLQTLKQMAKETGVDVAYLCRLFQRFDHQSPYQTLVRLKMNDAAEQLRTTQKRIKDIGVSLGYADAFHFSRAFKSVFGISPQAFRRLKF